MLRADVPLDAIRKVLGHASLQISSICVQAEQQRLLREVGQYYARLTELGDASDASAAAIAPVVIEAEQQCAELRSVFKARTLSSALPAHGSVRRSRGRPNEAGDMPTPTDRPAVIWRIRLSLPNVKPETRNAVVEEVVIELRKVQHCCN